MSNDDLDNIPPIVASRDNEQHFATSKSRPRKTSAGASPNPRPAPPRSGGAGIWARLFIAVAIAAAGVACGWAWQLQEQLKISENQAERYERRISDLEDRLSDTDEGLSQNTAAQAVKIKELYAEVDKLWASAWRTNKAKIADLETASAAQGKTVAATSKSLATIESQVKAASADLAKLKGVAGDLQRLMASAKTNQAEVERVADKLNAIDLEFAKLNKRVQSNEEWVGSMNAFRRQVNASVSELQASVRSLRSAGP